MNHHNRPIPPNRGQNHVQLPPPEMLASGIMNGDETPPAEVHEAFEIHGKPGLASVLVICEHASNRVPSPLQSTDTDRPALLSHWGWDVGVREVGRQVIEDLSASGVMARFTRLVCDANRDPLQGTFIRSHIEHRPLSFNQDLSDVEVDRRIETYHHAYHQAVHDMVADRKALGGRFLLLSIHSFTPVWGHGVRELDFGVLFSLYDDLAAQLAEQLRMGGFLVGLNQPYSAADGLAYSVERHGQAHRVPFLELEINQALLGSTMQARAIGRELSQALSRLIIPSVDPAAP